jgi:hypothetical protein
LASRKRRHNPFYISAAARIFPLVLTRLLPLCLPIALATADTIELKSGETVEGRITRTDDKTITVEVQFSPTIVDERTISRTDIAHFAVQSGDEAAFAKIRDVTTPATALDAATCQKIIDGQLQPFLRQFPQSARAADVQKKIQALRADIKRIEGGDARVAGIWHAKADAAAEKYQIDAAAVVEDLRLNLAAKDYAAAANNADLLLRNYGNSLAFVEGVKLADEAIAKLQQKLNFDLANLAQTKARRQAAIDRTPVEQRQPIQQAIAAENARAAAAAAAAQKNQLRFYTIFPFDEKGLKSMQVAARQLQQKLDTIDREALEEGGRLVRRATEELAAHELPATETTLAQLQGIWPNYEGLARLEQRLQAAKTAAASAAADKKP